MIVSTIVRNWIKEQDIWSKNVPINNDIYLRNIWNFLTGYTTAKLLMKSVNCSKPGYTW